MQKDTATILIASVVLSAAIVGGLWYYNTVYLPGHKSRLPSNSADELDFYFDPTARTNQIIECEDPEIGTFFTNAAACEGADLDNRLSEAQVLSNSVTSDLARKKNSIRKSAAQSANSRNRGNLRLHAENPPPNLPPECRFPVGKALEFERSMSVADDPYTSIWRKTYCEFRCEIKEHDCPVSENIFKWSYRSMCGRLRPPYCAT